MSRNEPGHSWSALGWFLFPLVPTFLGRLYQGVFNSPHGPAPGEWPWSMWVLLAGPLLGYGFLAGATLGLPDDPEARGFRSWGSRRVVWVSVGPWVGFLIGAALFAVWNVLGTLLPQVGEVLGRFLWRWSGPVVEALVVGVLAYGWLLVAVAVIRRGRRAGACRRAIERGLAVAMAFVGSLFGSFWAITEAWRSYFFDPRIVPLLLAASSLVLSAGCTSTVTYGELRRRDLFGAMLTSWLLGLALAWRWWSRPRSKP